MIKISTSILTAKNRDTCILKLNSTNTDYLHIDVMDGKFVPNKQFEINEINKLLPLSKNKIDLHLMVEDPEYYLNNINPENIEYCTIHREIKKDIPKIINKIKQKNIKVGLAIKPKTSINKISKYLDMIDMVLIMSVEPGFGGQTFIENTYEKINEIKKLNKNIIIEVDGGINDQNIKKLSNQINIAVVGSYITNSTNFKKTINKLKK